MRQCVLLAWVLGLAMVAPGGARQAEPDDAALASSLKRLSMEELLQVEVTSASKRPATVASTPAAVAVVTAEDLRRSGARTLADALRTVAGMHVARLDSRTWAVSARGLNQTTANKLLVLIDGRSVYTPLFSGVFWDVQTPLLEDVARIEVVRGPGATLWGANAVNGVVNVITFDAADTQGGLLTAGAGNEVSFGAVRWGGRLGEGHYRVSAKVDRLDGLAFADGRDADDPLRLARVGFRADLPAAGGDVTLLGDVYGGRIGHPSLADTDVDGASFQARWARTLAGGSEVEVRAWADHAFRRVPAQFREERGTVDVEAQQRWQRGRHDLLWGGGYRRSADTVRDSAVLAWEPGEETITIGSLFVQDDLRLAPEWRVVAGVRVEDQSTMDPEVLPGLTLAWEPAAQQLVWLGAGRAIRAPTRIDRDVRVPGRPPFVVVGSRSFRPEEVLAYELGYRTGALPGDATMDVIVFWNDYDDLRSQEPSAGGLPLVLGNRLEGRTRGAALALAVAPRRWLELQAGLTLLDTELTLEAGSRDPTGGVPEANDPDYLAHVRADFLLPRDLEVNVALRHVDELPDPAVPAYTELDLRLGWLPRPHLELALVGENLLDDRHPEFGSPLSREEVERGVYAQVLWRF